MNELQRCCPLGRSRMLSSAGWKTSFFFFLLSWGSRWMKQRTSFIGRRKEPRGQTQKETEMKSFQCFVLFIRLLIKCRKPQSPIVPTILLGTKLYHQPHPNLKQTHTGNSLKCKKNRAWHQFFFLRSGTQKKLILFSWFICFIYVWLSYLLDLQEFSL